MNGYPIVGDIYESIVRSVVGAVQKAKGEEPVMNFGNELAIFRIAQTLEKAVKLIDPDKTPDQFWSGIEGVADTVGAATGLPTAQTYDIAKGFSEMLVNENIPKGLLMTMGYSAYAAGKAFPGGGTKEQLTEAKTQILDEDSRKAYIDSLRADIKAGTIDKEAAKKELKKFDSAQKNLKEVNAMLDYITNKGLAGEKLGLFMEKIQDKDYMKAKKKDPMNKSQIKMLEEKLTGKTEKKEERGAWQLYNDYLKAWRTDPPNAWKVFATKEKLGKVEGNLVELQRFYGLEFYDKGGSEEVKKRLMEEMGIPLEQIGDYKLEHILPVSAGGGNEDGNLVPINNAEHDFYTPIDIMMGKAVKDGTITRMEAKRMATGLKVKKTVTAEEVLEEISE